MNSTDVYSMLPPASAINIEQININDQAQTPARSWKGFLVKMVKTAVPFMLGAAGAAALYVTAPAGWAFFAGACLVAGLVTTVYIGHKTLFANQVEKPSAAPHNAPRALSTATLNNVLLANKPGKHQAYQAVKNRYHSVLMSLPDKTGFYSKRKPLYSLTNYHQGKSPIIIDGLGWATSEHYFQCAKFKPGSTSWNKIRNNPSPDHARDYAGKNFNTQNPDCLYGGVVQAWIAERDRVMWKALTHKAVYDTQYRTELTTTGNTVLFEDSPFDSYWGVGRDGRGDNTLGYMHMVIRDMINKGEL